MPSGISSALGAPPPPDGPSATTPVYYNLASPLNANTVTSMQRNLNSSMYNEPGPIGSCVDAAAIALIQSNYNSGPEVISCPFTAENRPYNEGPSKFSRPTTPTGRGNRPPTPTGRSHRVSLPRHHPEHPENNPESNPLLLRDSVSLPHISHVHPELSSGIKKEDLSKIRQSGLVGHPGNISSPGTPRLQGETGTTNNMSPTNNNLTERNLTPKKKKNKTPASAVPPATPQQATKTKKPTTQTQVKNPAPAPAFAAFIPTSTAPMGQAAGTVQTRRLAKIPEWMYIERSAECREERAKERLTHDLRLLLNPTCEMLDRSVADGLWGAIFGTTFKFNTRKKKGNNNNSDAASAALNKKKHFNHVVLGNRAKYLINLFLPPAERLEVMCSQAESIGALASFLLVSDKIFRINASGDFTPSKNTAEVAADAPKTYFDKCFHEHCCDWFGVFLTVWQWVSFLVFLGAILLSFTIRTSLLTFLIRLKGNHTSANIQVTSYICFVDTISQASNYLQIAMTMILYMVPWNIVHYGLPGFDIDVLAYSIKIFLISIWITVYVLIKKRLIESDKHSNPVCLLHQYSAVWCDPIGVLVRHFLVCEHQIQMEAKIQIRNLIGHDLAQSHDLLEFVMERCPEILDLWVLEEVELTCLNDPSIATGGNARTGIYGTPEDAKRARLKLQRNAGLFGERGEPERGEPSLLGWIGLNKPRLLKEHL